MVHPLLLRSLGILALCPIQLGAYYAFDIGGSAGMASKTDDGPMANTIEGVFTMAGQSYSHAMNQAMYSAYQWPNVVFAIVCGQLIDHHWSLEKSTFAFSAMVAVGLSVFAIGLVGTWFPVMVLARVVYGIGGEGIWVAVHIWKDRVVKGTPLTAVGAGVVIGSARIAGTLQFLSGTRIGSSWTVFGLATTCIVWSLLCFVGAALIVVVYPKIQALTPTVHHVIVASGFQDSQEMVLEKGPAIQAQPVSETADKSPPLLPQKGKDCNGHTQVYYTDALDSPQALTPDEVEVECGSSREERPRTLKQALRWFWTEAFPLYRLKALSPGAWLAIATIAAVYPALLPWFGFAKNAFQVRANMSADEAGAYVALGEAFCAFSCPVAAVLITALSGRLPIFLFVSTVLLTALHFVSAIVEIAPLLHVCLFALCYGVIASCMWPLLGIIGTEDVHGISYGAAVSGETLTQAVFPLIVGSVLDHYTPSGASLASAEGYQAANALLGVSGASSAMLSFAFIVWDLKANGGKLCRGQNQEA